MQMYLKEIPNMKELWNINLPERKLSKQNPKNVRVC